MDSTTQKAHFYRRASFGATRAELEDKTPPHQLLERWLKDVQPTSKIIQLAYAPREGMAARKALQNKDQKGLVRFVKQRKAKGQEFSESLLAQMLTASNPLHERMTNLWRDHFVVGVKKIKFPELLSDYENRLRAHAFGDFRELLWQVTTSPAMMIYLDSQKNSVDKPNENYSRELLELFTTGRGAYTEQDVKEGARGLTGWVINPRDGKTTFVSRRHDGATKTYLGRSGNLKPEDVVDIVANHPATAQHLSRKLWSHFVYDHPEPAVIQRLAQVYTNSGRNLGQVVRAIFNSPEFYSPKAYRSQLKNPMYFILGTLRQLQLTADSRKVLASLKTMGQLPYNAPSVKGWPDDEGWLSAPSLLTRINLAQKFTQEYGDESGFSFAVEGYSVRDLTQLLLDGNPSPDIQSALKGLSPRESAAVLIASPLYQLA